MIYITNMYRVYCYKVYSNKTITKWNTNTIKPAIYDVTPIITLLSCDTYTKQIISGVRKELEHIYPTV